MAESNVEYEKCKYCDNMTYAGREICGSCMPKVLLVRELIKAGQELRQRLDELAKIEKDSQKGGGGDGRGEMD